MIIYQSRFLTRGEVWFDESPSAEPVDWIVYHQRPQPISRGHWRPFYTRVIDLSQSADSLLAQMDGFTASDIRKAEKKDQTVCRRVDLNNAKVLSDFADFYDRFAALKHLGPADRHWLERTTRAGKLDLWAADGSEGNRLAYHMFYLGKNRVRSLHAASFYAEAGAKEAQRKIGRANRLLIWETMMRYQAEGVQIYDLGGWYTGTADTGLLGVNKFKEGFGGKVVCEYEGELLKTLKARTAVAVARLLKKCGSSRMGKTENLSSRREIMAGLKVGETITN